MDKGHQLTDKILSKTEKRIIELYKNVYNEVQGKYAKLLMKLEDTKDPQKAFNLKKQKKKLETMLNSIALEINNANKTAIALIKDTNLEIYALNNQFTIFDLDKKSGYMLDLPLYNKNILKELASTSKNVFTQIAFDELTNKKAIINTLKRAMASAIIQGEGMQQIAKRIKEIMNKSMNKSLLIARTETTRVENLARRDTFKNAEKIGIELEKEWISTIDSRTRSSHQSLMLEKKPLDKPFSNGLMFPGDPSGSAKEVCRCRCTMVSKIIDVPQTQKEKELDEEIKRMSFEQWRKEKVK